MSGLDTSRSSERVDQLPVANSEISPNQGEIGARESVGVTLSEKNRLGALVAIVIKCT